MTENSEKSRDRGTVRKILDTAAEVFAEVGFAGSRIDEIARCAGVNKATIYYHIGGKEALYAAVLHDVLTRKGAALAEIIDTALPPEEKLRRYIREFHQTIAAQPLIPAIMLREAASGGKNLPEMVIQDFITMFNVLADILEEGVAQGIFVRISPLLVHLMIVMPLGAMNKLSPLTDRFIGMPETQRFARYGHTDTAQEIEACILRALKR